MAASRSPFDYFQLPIGLFPLMNDKEMSPMEPKNRMCNRSTPGNGADGRYVAIQSIQAGRRQVKETKMTIIVEQPNSQDFNDPT